MRFGRHFFIILMSVITVAISSQSAFSSEASSPKILVIGDSLMGWHQNRQRSVGDKIGELLNEPVQLRAISGAKFITLTPFLGAMGFMISKQYKAGPWDWVVMSGGGNDLAFGCGCEKCDARIDKMVGANGQTGVVPDLVKEITKSGASVVISGYLRSPGVNSIIENCKAPGDKLEQHMKAMADSLDRVHYVSHVGLVPHGDKSFHAFDMVHPSPKGSEQIAKRIVETIIKNDTARKLVVAKKLSSDK